MKTARYLPLKLGDQADAQLCQLRGLIDLLSVGAQHVNSDETIPAVCWLIDEKLTRLQQIVDARRPPEIPAQDGTQ